MKKYERVKALVSLDAIAHNFEEMHKNVKEGTKIIAVIKADGYGHGARAIARLIQDYDYIWGFATATAEEALELRHAGITKPVLILGLVFEEYYEELAANDIRITISDLNTAAEYAKAGARIGKNVHIHLALDTGMTRIGYADIPENAVKIEEISKIPNLVIEGMFTHFARADEFDRSPALVQLDRYLRFADLLEKRDGLILGICNGFQALIKLGLVPYGEIRPQTADSPTLTYNTIGRHISKMVYTKVVTDKSPWLAQAELGKVYCNPASHGEGRFVAPKEWLDKLFANGQVATQYVNEAGVPTMDEEWNVNGSYCSIEGITSPDGRVLGKMAHSERRDRSVAINIYGEQDLKIFESGVAYFK